MTGTGNFAAGKNVSAVSIQVIQSFQSIFLASAPINGKNQIRDIYRCLNTPKPFSVLIDYTKYESNPLTKWHEANQILTPYPFENDAIKTKANFCKDQCICSITLMDGSGLDGVEVHGGECWGNTKEACWKKGSGVDCLDKQYY